MAAYATRHVTRHDQTRRSAGNQLILEFHSITKATIKQPYTLMILDNNMSIPHCHDLGVALWRYAARICDQKENEKLQEKVGDKFCKLIRLYPHVFLIT